MISIVSCNSILVVAIILWVCRANTTAVYYISLVASVWHLEIVVDPA